MARPEMEIVVAFLDKNQGFANGRKFPWPYLKGDHQMYVKLTTTTKDPEKKNAYIIGRISWEVWQEDEKSNPKIFTVVTSTTLKSEGVKYLQQVLPTMDDAITYLTTPPVNDQIEKIYLMGGGQNYTDAIDDPRLKRIYVTRVFGDFAATRFFPKFQHKFHRVPSGLDESIHEDNGVKYRFELWERNS